MPACFLHSFEILKEDFSLSNLVHFLQISSLMTTGPALLTQAYMPGERYSLLPFLDSFTVIKRITQWQFLSWQVHGDEVTQPPATLHYCCCYYYCYCYYYYHLIIINIVYNFHKVIFSFQTRSSFSCFIFPWKNHSEGALEVK